MNPIYRLKPERVEPKTLDSLNGAELEPGDLILTDGMLGFVTEGEGGELGVAIFGTASKKPLERFLQKWSQKKLPDIFEPQTLGEAKDWADRSAREAETYRQVLALVATYLPDSVYLDEDGEHHDTPVLENIPRLVRQLTAADAPSSVELPQEVVEADDLIRNCSWGEDEEHPVDEPLDIIMSWLRKYKAELSELRAARYAYASEFPDGPDGGPDVGSIHENIRKLKRELQEYGRVVRTEVVREVGRDRAHVTTDHGDCVAWCPACGPQCEHGDNSYTCSKCRAEPPPDYTAPRAFAAEGARVGLVTCLKCGTVLLVDPGDRFDVLKLHEQWHEHLELHVPGLHGGLIPPTELK